MNQWMIHSNDPKDFANQLFFSQVSNFQRQEDTFVGLLMNILRWPGKLLITYKLHFCFDSNLGLCEIRLHRRYQKYLQIRYIDFCNRLVQQGSK